MSLWPVSLDQSLNPASLERARLRAQNLQNRVADRITLFAGSMAFVYVHVVWFGLLTLIVSLEAIFLSTFVMISQNRADEKREVLSQHQWEFVVTEEKQNEQLLAISGQILGLPRPSTS